jgi:hypothetical protein
MSRHPLTVWVPCLALFAALCVTLLCALAQAVPPDPDDPPPDPDKVAVATARLKQQLAHPETLEVLDARVTSVPNTDGGPPVGFVEVRFRARGKAGISAASTYRLFFGRGDAWDGLPQDDNHELDDPHGLYQSP